MDEINAFAKGTIYGLVSLKFNVVIKSILHHACACPPPLTVY